MRSPHGIAITTDGDTGRQVKRDVVVCCHCQRVSEVDVGPMLNFPWCWKCHAPTCQRAACTSTCDPWERQLERAEAKHALLRAVRG